LDWLGETEPEAGPRREDNHRSRLSERIHDGVTRETWSRSTIEALGPPGHAHEVIPRAAPEQLSAGPTAPAGCEKGSESDRTDRRLTRRGGSPGRVVTSPRA